jgi:hypothetical protein
MRVSLLKRLRNGRIDSETAVERLHLQGEPHITRGVPVLQAPKWGRVVGFHRHALSIFIPEVRGRSWKLLFEVVVKTLRAKHKKLT